jgi:hypothetical protein
MPWHFNSPGGEFQFHFAPWRHKLRAEQALNDDLGPRLLQSPRPNIRLQEGSSDIAEQVVCGVKITGCRT